MKKIFVYNSFSNMMPELIVWMIYLHKFGWNMSEIALLEGTFTVCSAIFEVPSGIIADRIGKKTALQLGEVICILYLLSYFFPQQHFVIYIGFICFALGLALISGTDTSLLYNMTEGNKFIKFMGYFNAIGIFSVAIGNLIGGWLASVSWGLLFIVSILCRIISLSSITLLSDNFSKDSTEIDNDSITLIHHLKLIFTYTKKNKKFKYLLLSSAFLISSVTLSYQYIPMILNNLTISTGEISILYSILSIGGAVLSLMSEKITDKLSIKFTAILLFVLIIGSFISIGIFSSVAVIIMFSFVIPNVLYELLIVILDTKVHKELIDSIRVSSLSIINFINSALLTMGSLVVSFMPKSLDLTIIISVICTISAIISLSTYLNYERKA